MNIKLKFWEDKRAEEERKIDNAHMLFSSPLGQEVLEHLYKVAEMDKTSFHETSAIMAYKEGRKSLMIDLLNLADADTMKLRLKILTDEARSTLKNLDNEEY